MEDYYDSSFYFHAGIFQLPVSGVTHMCAGGGHASPPHPACPANGTVVPATSQWSGYRFHEKDPLWFEDGVQLIVRNGDVGGPVSYGTAKCCTPPRLPYAPILLPEAAVSVFGSLGRVSKFSRADNLNMKGGPGVTSTVSSLAWVYEFAE